MRPWQPLALKSLKIIGDLTLSPRTFWRFNFSSGKQVAKSKNITLIWINMPSRPKCSWVNVWPWRPASSSGSESPAMELVSSFTEEKGVRGLFHAWNLLKLTFIYTYIYAYLCIHTRQFKSRDDGDKGTMIGPDKEFKLWVVQNSWCWDSACRSGLQFVQMTWMCRASYAQWRLQLPPWHLCRQKEAALCWGNMFFWLCFLFLRNYVAFYICHMSWMRRRLWFDHKYPWILWCAMATCAWYIRGVK